jgi:hypothetical protein
MALADMDTIRNTGLAEFSANYFWPISDDEFTMFVHSTMEVFESLIVDSDQTIFDLAIVDYRFLMFLIQHVHYSAAFEEISKNNQAISNSSLSLKNLIYPNWQTHIDYLSVENLATGHFGNARHTLYSQVGHRLRNYLRSMQLNFPKHSYHSLLPDNSLVHASIGPYSGLKAAFLKTQETIIRVCEWDNFSSPRVPRNTAISSALLNQFLDPFLGEFERYSKEFGARIDVRSIKACWLSRFEILFGFYESFRSCSSLPTELSISAAGNPIRKALGTASKRNGTKVFVFHHGECPGVERYPHAHRNDGSFADFFICPTAPIKRNFQENYSRSPIEQRAGTVYIAAQSDHFDDMRRIYRPAYSSPTVNTAMLIGFGMNHTRYLDGAGYFYYFQIDLQYRLCLLIRKLGYRLIYKVHPDRAAEVGTLFNEVADVVEARPFEQCWDMASSYVFSHPGSTVFGHAVFTDKPILLLDLENNNWNNNGYELLKRRCQTVRTTFDNSNRLLFDESEFEEKFGNPLDLNDDYIDSYC